MLNDAVKLRDSNPGTGDPIPHVPGAGIFQLAGSCPILFELFVIVHYTRAVYKQVIVYEQPKF